MLPQEEFENHPNVTSLLYGAAQGNVGPDGFDSAFLGQTIPLRRYLGYYLSYFLSHSWENSVICAMVRLDEHEGMVRCRSLERSVDPEDGSLFLSKYSGRVAFLGGRNFIMEFQTLARGRDASGSRSRAEPGADHGCRVTRRLGEYLFDEGEKGSAAGLAARAERLALMCGRCCVGGGGVLHQVGVERHHHGWSPWLVTQDCRAQCHSA
ncbi:hypothetical protein [Ostreiculturibacter nitratireducens]|uniref:hypothetical protein n=1 Tax=Ostreiculturibacter nitratireducens TaxID=3075226 RepID=UPI0031B585F0